MPHAKHRQAFGPGRRMTKTQLAKDITASIRSHHARGVTKLICEYTVNEEIVQMVCYELYEKRGLFTDTRPAQSVEAQRQRQVQQAWLDGTRTRIIAS